MASFGDRLRSLREEADLHQKEVADKVGVKRNTVTSWENGDRQPEVGRLEKVADLFSVSTDYLLGRSDVRLNIENRERVRDTMEVALADVRRRANLSDDDMILVRKQLDSLIETLVTLKGKG